MFGRWVAFFTARCVLLLLPQDGDDSVDAVGDASSIGAGDDDAGGTPSYGNRIPSRIRIPVMDIDCCCDCSLKSLPNLHIQQPMYNDND